MPRSFARSSGLLALIFVAASACKPTDPCLDCPPPDGGLADAGLPDAALPDASLADAGRPDSGLPDASLADAGRPDSGLPDASPGDAATPDAATPDGGAAACPSFAPGVALGRTPDTILPEASGIVAGRRNRDTLWLHNDSGAGPRIFALTASGAGAGTTQAQYDLDGASADDWEDIAIGPGPTAGTSYLYVGDIGDNSTSRGNIDVYRVAEPDVKTGSPTTPTRLTGVEHFKLKYPDGAHNAETLLVDPRSGDLYVVVKSSDGVSPVFRAAAPLSSAATITLSKIATLRFGTAPLTGDKTTTGGDISPGGEAIAIRTYTAAYLFRRPAGSSVADALASPPCRIPLQLELQGEALGFASDDSGYYTVSEGNRQPIYFYARR